MKKTMKKAAALLLSATMLVGFSACGGSSAENSDTIKIGVNYELSGDVATYGQSCTKGIEMAVNEVNEAGGINGKKVEIVKIDNKSDNNEAMSAATKLASKEGVSVMIGPATSGAFKATIAAANQYKVPAITCSGTSDDITVDSNGNVQEYIFRLCYTDSLQGSKMAEFATKKLNAKSAIVLADTSNDYSNGLAKAFESEFKANGGTIVSTETFTAQDKDFSPVLTKIKDKKADVIYLPGYYTECSLIIKQARELGIDLPILGADGYDSPTMLETAGAEALENVYYTNHYAVDDESEVVQNFVKAYKAANNDENPGAFETLGYDAGKLACDAIARAGSADPQKVSEALAATKDFQAVTGTLSIDEKHNPVKETVVLEFKDGNAVFNTKL
ncbi:MULTISPECIES: ABC transporter substrate-binding protein [Anaerofustis]|uniref:ABC transporter substrate-binding protein n=1 Tax=Anaerofustis TaxID=264995 RepID=UPI001485BAB1|nr:MULTISPECIES: ABC transporter substrate-binding protein [Anaerofustis]MCO8194047.1 ABC transporter substrate-binding protein [Anaerofustis sp. NSJ-163]